MTKLMEEAFAVASRLPDEDQELLAAQILADIKALDDDAPVPEWQKRLLRERRASRQQTPERLISLEEVVQTIDQRRRQP